MRDPDAPAAACPGCGEMAARWGAKGEHLLHRCHGCGTIFIAEAPDTAGELYEHYYDGTRFEMPPIVAASLERLVRSAEPYRRTGRWLDVGYGEGGLLRTAEQHGWRCHGTEVSGPMLAYGAARGWSVADSLDHDHFPSSAFDVVTMIELIEHVPHPRRFLHQAARLLRPGGLLYLTTPNAWSLNRCVLGADWSVFAPPEHLTIWTRRGLRRALREAGLRSVAMRTEGLNPVEILARFRSRGGQAPPIHRAQAGVALSTALSGSPARRLLKSAANAVLSTFGVGDTVKSWAVREPEAP